MAADVASSVRLPPEYYPVELREKYHLQSSLYTASSHELPSVQPGWYPDRLQYERQCRSQRDMPHGPLQLPEGWPDKLRSPLAWNRNDFDNEDAYIYKLDGNDLAMVSDALAHFKSLNLHPSKASIATFPLGALGQKLQELSEEVHYGKGFVVVRGLRPQDYDIEENSIIYLGMSSYIAERRGRQNIFGQMMHHIIDASESQVPSSERQSIYSNVSQPYHADVCCDILALFWIGVPEYGGETTIASSWTVYNELAKSRPDLIRTLAAKDWVHNTFNFRPPYHTRPLLFLNDESRPILNFSRRVLTGNKATPRSPSAPPISKAQAEALDAVHFLAQENSLRMKPQLGDMRFINNFSILHSRDEFQDSARNKRHVLRLWLRNDDLGWSIPEGLRLAWERVFAPLKSVPEEWDVFPNTNPGQRVMVRPPNQSSDCG